MNFSPIINYNTWHVLVHGTEYIDSAIRGNNVHLNRSGMFGHLLGYQNKHKHSQIFKLIFWLQGRRCSISTKYENITFRSGL